VGSSDFTRSGEGKKKKKRMPTEILLPNIPQLVWRPRSKRSETTYISGRGKVERETSGKGVGKKREKGGLLVPFSGSRFLGRPVQ